MNNNKSLKRIVTGLFFIIIILGIIFFICNIKYKCIFKELFIIPCPACGLTRAFFCILNFQFVEAMKYNILSVPLFILIVVFLLVYIFSFIFKKDYIIKLYKLYTKYPLVIVLCLIISFIYNLFRY